MASSLNQGWVLELAARFDAAWRKAQVGSTPPPTLADYLPTDCDRTPALIELLYYELEYRALIGEPVSLDMYVADFPELASQSQVLDDLRQHATACRDRIDNRRNDRLVPGTHVDQFEIGEFVAAGGMGDVYRALDKSLRRSVAVKLLQGRHRANADLSYRFLEEAQITGQLQHPGIPPVYQIGTLNDGRPYLAMKLIVGQTLEELIKDNAPLNLLAVFEAVAQAVGYAHENGIIHRDLKPQNIMVGPFGEVQVMDWGLDKHIATNATENSVEQREDSTDVQTHRNRNTPVTQTGVILGTIAYMAPEQAAGANNRIDQRSDVFGLGAILCAMLTGEPPFTGCNIVSVHHKAQSGELNDVLTKLDAVAADPEVVALCRRCLAFEPALRLPNGNAVATEVARIRTDAEERAKRAELARVRTDVQLTEQRKKRRALIIAGAAIVVSLLIAVIGTSTGWMSASVARASESKRATNEAAALRRASAVSTFIVSAFRKVEPQALGDEAKVSDVLEQAHRELHKIDDLEIRSEILTVIGTVYASLGLHRRAIDTFEEAHRLLLTWMPPDDRSVLKVEFLIGSRYAYARDTALALSILEPLLSKQSYYFGPNDPDAIRTANIIVLVLAHSTELETALRRVEVLQRLCRDHFGSAHELSRMVSNTYADVLSQAGRRDEALNVPHIKRLLEAVNNDGTVTGGIEIDEINSETIMCIRNIVFHNRDQNSMNRMDRCLSNLRAGKQSATNPHSLIREHVSLMVQTKEGLKLRRHRDIMAILDSTLGPEHEHTMMVMHNIAHLILNRCLPENVGMDDSRAREMQYAVTYSEKYLSWCRANLGSNNFWTVNAIRYLAGSYMEVQRHVDALPLLKEAYLSQYQKLGKRNPHTFYVQVHLAECFCRNARHREAEYHFRCAIEGLKAFLTTVPDSVTESAWARCQLGLALLGQGKIEEAIRELRSGRDEVRSLKEVDDDRRAQKHQRLNLVNVWLGTAEEHLRAEKQKQLKQGWNSLKEHLLPRK